MSNGSPEENLKQIFRVFDINNDGSISLKELQRIVKDLFHLINEQNADEASQEVLAQSGSSHREIYGFIFCRHLLLGFYFRSLYIKRMKTHISKNKNRVYAV